MKEYVVGVKLLQKPEMTVTIWFVNNNNEITCYKHSDYILQQNDKRESYKPISNKKLITTILFEFNT
jgi:hypothetical protein